MSLQSPLYPDAWSILPWDTSPPWHPSDILPGLLGYSREEVDRRATDLKGAAQWVQHRYGLSPAALGSAKERCWPEPGRLPVASFSSLPLPHLCLPPGDASPGKQRLQKDSGSCGTFSGGRGDLDQRPHLLSVLSSLSPLPSPVFQSHWAVG